MGDKPGKPRLSKAQIKQIVKLRNEKDLSTIQIGKMLGRHPSTIFRVLEKNSEEYQALQRFKNNDSELLDDIRFKNTKIRAALYDSLLGDDCADLCTLPADKRVQLIHPLTVDSGIDTEKSLLLKGKSTQIIENKSLVIQAVGTLNQINERLADAQIIGSDTPVTDTPVDK